MENYGELIRMVWLVCGSVSVMLLAKSPDKFVFEHTFWGQMKKSNLLIIAFMLGILGGPISLTIYLLLPRRKVCNSCGKINSIENTICEYCNNPFQSQADTQIEEHEANPLARFSDEIQLVVTEGQKRVNMPIPFVMIGVWIVGSIISFIFDGHPIFPLLILATFLIGFISGWLWWSFSVPRWREWALKQPGVTPDELQNAAELALLVWPKNHFFERTEIKPKK